MRVCRVCLAREGNEPFQPIMEKNCKIAELLFYLFEIMIVEKSGELPALICCKCVDDITSAARLKKISLVADKFFRKQSREIEEFFFKEFKGSVKVEEEGSEIVEYMDEIIEYDDTIEAIDDEDDWPEEVKCEESFPELNVIVQVAPARKMYAPRNMRGQNTRQCHECGIVFSSHTRLRNHTRVRHDVVPDSEMLPCEICGKKFKIQEYLEHHIKNMHSNTPQRQKEKHPCSVCGNILSSSIALRNHEERHTIDMMKPEEIRKPFVCDMCGLRLRLKCYLFNHMHNVHIRQKYPCTVCSQRFYKKHEFDDHFRQHHTNETPFKCEFGGCGKSFARKKNLLIHRRIHTGVCPYPCSLCPKAFMHFIDRKRHMISHTGQHPHCCNLCSRGFMRKSELESHMRSHYSQVNS